MAKKLLLVDDEEFFLEGLKDGLSEYEDIFTTDICFSVEEAIKLYSKNQYDLIISDIRMPGKSGLDFFVYLREKNYNGGFIAMTAYGSVEVLEKIRSLGGLDIILKPFDFPWFKDKILDFFSEEEGVSGTVDSIALTSLLQMINLEKKSLIVRIEDKTSEGFLYFNKGEIVHAEYLELEGEEAAFHLTKMKKGRFSLLKWGKKVKKTIETPFMVLLMNAMKVNDEETQKFQLYEKYMGSKKKEKKMNVKKLNEAIEIQKANMGEGLLATDIYGSRDGQSLVGWNSNPQACALFNRITNYMTEALDGAGFPALGRYYIVDLADGKMVIVISLGEFQWGMLADRRKIQLGLLLNVIMPKMIDAFEQSMTE
jgi:YesN/AraC family two-component response regulator